MDNNSKQVDQQALVHPMYLFAHEMKKKQLKLSSLSSITTISLVLGPQKTKSQLVPYLATIFPNENNQVKKAIINALKELLQEQYIGKAHNSCCILETIIDILCVYSAKQIREEAYGCLEKVLSFMDVRKAQKMLIKALKRLNGDAFSEEEKQKNSIQVNNNIKELVLRMIPYIYMGVDTENEQELLQILNVYKNSLNEMKMVAEVLKELIKVMPPAPQTYIREVIEFLLEKRDLTINNLLIEAVILLAKISGEDSTITYFHKILQDSDNKIVCTCLKNYHQLSGVFSEDNMKPILRKIQNYQNQPQQVKNVILEMLDSLTLSEEVKEKVLQPPTSLQLKTTLAQSLCRLHDCEGLGKLLESSEANFKIKIFPQLPPLNEFHIKVVESILRNKSWRPKLTILENINKRIKQKQNSVILVPVFFGFVGDKIAAVRTGIVTSLALILKENGVQFGEVQKELGRGVRSQNWFERQGVLRIILQTLKLGGFDPRDRSLKSFMEKQTSQKIKNIRMVSEDILKILK